MADRTDLRQAGLKTTVPRLKVLSILENNRGKHLGAEDVYKILLAEDETIGLATVYRVLTQFESAGLVLRHNFEGERAVFELNDDEHHDHMVCVECDTVIEFYDKTIEKQQELIAKKHSFQIKDHALYLYGVCKNCAKKTA